MMPPIVGLTDGNANLGQDDARQAGESMLVIGPAAKQMELEALERLQT
jgi:hypothetical protein